MDEGGFHFGGEAGRLELITLEWVREAVRFERRPILAPAPAYNVGIRMEAA